VKPPTGVSVIVVIPELPAAMVSEVGLSVREKFGALTITATAGDVEVLKFASPE
jgi:hypothetical protein